MDEAKVISIRYEDFVSRPVAALESIAQFVGLRYNLPALEHACAQVRTSSSRENQAELSDQRSLHVMAPILKKYGYLVNN